MNRRSLLAAIGLSPLAVMPVAAAAKSLDDMRADADGLTDRVNKVTREIFTRDELGPYAGRGMPRTLKRIPYRKRITVNGEVVWDELI